MSTNTALDELTPEETPRTIGTFTELLEVKQGAVLADKGGAVMKLEPSYPPGAYGRWVIEGEPGHYPYSSVHLPATLLREPEAEVAR